MTQLEIDLLEALTSVLPYAEKYAGILPATSIEWIDAKNDIERARDTIASAVVYDTVDNEDVRE